MKDPETKDEDLTVVVDFDFEIPSIH